MRLIKTAAMAALILICSGANLSCSNIFSSLANKNTDKALIEDAKKSLDAQNYTQAINDIQTLQADYPKYQTDPTALMLLASGYAGQCGFNFFNFFNSVTTVPLGSTPILQWLMSFWDGQTTNRVSCRLAENTVKLITPTYQGRDPNQSFFLVLLGLAKIGIWEHELFDPTGTGTVQDPYKGPPGGPSNPFCCSTSGCMGGNNFLQDSDVAEIGVGIGLVIANLTNIGTTLSGANLSDVTTFCTNLATTLGSNPCLVEDETTFLANPAYVLAIRTALDTNPSSPSPFNSGAIGLTSGQACP